MYINRCWFPGCGVKITSKNSKQCPVCGWYICPVCGSCKKGCPHRDSEGYDRDGFDKNGIHRNGTKYGDTGFDINGYDKNGYNHKGLDVEGFNRSGYNSQGFNREGIHKNGTIFDDNGLTADGLDKIDLQCREYTVGTKVVLSDIVGEIIEYDPQITQPCIKIKFKNGKINSYGLKILIRNGLIRICT